MGPPIREPEIRPKVAAATANTCAFGKSVRLSTILEKAMALACPPSRATAPLRIPYKAFNPKIFIKATPTRF